MFIFLSRNMKITSQKIFWSDNALTHLKENKYVAVRNANVRVFSSRNMKIALRFSKCKSVYICIVKR